jgi:mono/diheme cytochrome c family protein
MFKSFWGYVVIGVPILGLGVLLLGPTSSTVGHDMTPPDTSSADPGGPLAAVIVPASLSDNAKFGKNAYEGMCAACHGVNAAGQNGIAPPLVHKIYEPSHHGDQAFWSATQNGVQSHHWNFGNMPPVAGLTRSDVGYIVAYVRELQQANGIN